ncbi:MAG TPA: hypothetical protein VGD89_16330 [Flavipsychrobacter sp.]
MKYTILSLVFALFLDTPVFSQHATQVRLKAISDSMYVKGNPNYIVVDAIADGLIADDEEYSVNYYNQTLYINGRKVDDSCRQRYTEKYIALLEKVGISKSGTSFNASGGVYMFEILDPRSAFRNKKFDFGICKPKH